MRLIGSREETQGLAREAAGWERASRRDIGRLCAAGALARQNRLELRYRPRWSKNNYEQVQCGQMVSSDSKPHYCPTQRGDMALQSDLEWRRLQSAANIASFRAASKERGGRGRVAGVFATRCTASPQLFIIWRSWP
jgi:hypothetical protein